MPSAVIDGVKVSVPEKTTILEAARRIGIEIPTLCRLDGISPLGTCRVCLVEVRSGGEVRFVASCHHMLAEGMEVFTATPRVKRARSLVLELLLARCPDSIEVRKLASRYGVASPRFSVKHEDCILCGRCVQVCSEVVGAGALGFVGRGSDRRVGVPMDTHYEACIGCGACTYVCPTGAIQMEAEAVKRFRSRMLPGGQRCRHARLGSVSFRMCAHNFECSKCEFDQSFEDSHRNHPSIVVRPASESRFKTIDRFVFAPGREYGPGHLWTRAVAETVRVGIDDIAGKAIGRIKDIRLRRPGFHGEVGSVSAVVKTGDGRTVALTFPFAGTITTVNPLLSSNPSIALNDPYNRGWIFDIRPDPGVNLRCNRFAGKDAESWFHSEAESIERSGSGDRKESSSSEAGLDAVRRLLMPRPAHSGARQG